MENSPQYLFLASGVNNGEGFWIVGIKNCDENILEDENLLDCHRKELIGNESAKEYLLLSHYLLILFYGNLKDFYHQGYFHHNFLFPQAKTLLHYSLHLQEIDIEINSPRFQIIFSIFNMFCLI